MDNDLRQIAIAAEEAEWAMICEDDPQIAALDKLVNMAKRGIISNRELIWKFTEILND